MINRSDSYSKAVGTDSPGIERIRPSRAPPGQPISEESSSEPADDRQLLDYYLTKRKSEYSSPCDVNLLAGSFNVNGKEPKEALDHWLLRQNETPDIIVIGIQELQLDADAYFSEYVNAKESEKYQKCQESWKTSVMLALQKYNRPFQLIVDERLVGMYIMIFCSERIKPAISKVDTANVGCGLMGTFGNKGACSVSLKIHETSFCFVTSHLAAHQNAIKKRNQDYESIRHRTVFRERLRILDHERVFWLGDLNYRLDIPNDDVRFICQGDDISSLLPADQLHAEMNAGKIFKGFHEAPITFKPTYKFDSGTNNYDSSPKNRIPAYTDRILWLTKEPDSVECLSYSSHPSITISDHKPISACFRVRTEQINKQIYYSVYKEVTSWLDKHENELIPQVAVSSKAIDFGKLKFLERATANIQLQNTGKTPAQFQIIDSKVFSPDRDVYEAFNSNIGLSIDPNKGILPPDSGDASICTISFDLNINKEVVSKFNFGVKQGGNYVNPLDDLILILKLRNGPDHYITLSGDWTYSAFGMPFIALTHSFFKDVSISSLEYPATSLVLNQLVKAECSSSNSPSEQNFHPPAFYVLLNHIVNHGFMERQLFQINGDPDEVRAIIDTIDAEEVVGNLESLPGSVASVAEVLLLFLNSNPFPIIPYTHFELCTDLVDDHNLCKSMIEKLDLRSQNIFQYLIMFLKEVLKHGKINGCTSEFLAGLFSRCILRPQITLKNREKADLEKRKSVQFVRQFLNEDESSLI